MLRAVIFDFDGVIVDTEPLHLRAFNLVLAGEGMSVSENEFFSTYLGLNDETFLRTLYADRGKNADATLLKTLQAEKDKTYQSIISDGLPPLPGVVTFVDRTSKRWPLAICSGARRFEIETILRHADMLRYFPIIVSADEVALSKPDPAGYIQALSLLREKVPDKLPDLEGDQCLVIEDSLLGIAAAKAAGMRVLGVQSYHSEETMADADRSVPDLRSANDDTLMAIFD